MMKKVLFVCTVLRHIYAFHIPYLKWFHDAGWEVHILANSEGREAPPYCDKLYDVDIARSPFSPKNFGALKRAKEILRTEGYDLVHCHTPMGGVIGRLAAAPMRKSGKTKVLYTAHGFHFYKGAPKKNWLLYYRMEKWLAPLTDGIITINHEDFDLASADFASASTAVYRTDGIGVDPAKFAPPTPEERAEKRAALGFADGDFLAVYAAEFIPRKNQQWLIDRVANIARQCPRFRLLLCGSGAQLEEMQQYVHEKRLDENVIFLGYRTDMPDILKACDLLVSSSVQEGLAINLVEGLLSGVPAVVSAVRGHTDVITDGKNGYAVPLDDPEAFEKQILHLYEDPKALAALAANTLSSAEPFKIENTVRETAQIYTKYILKEQ